jgi:predicted DNA-binding transcriptional regulator YafY
MNRVDRLFGILLMLSRTQGRVRKRVRAEDVAQRFEVSQRTVYRDMAALGELGIPIVGTPNDGYHVLEGFFLPPLVFTPDEATALVLSAKLMTAEASPALKQEAQRALEKLGAALPELTRDRVHARTEVLQFYQPGRVFDTHSEAVVDIQTAIWSKKLMRIQYYSLSQDELTTRTIEPLALTYSNGNWYVTGYCRLRKAQRSFRLSRVQGYDVLEKTFKPRLEAQQTPESVDVRVRFDAGTLRWVEERQHYAFKRRDRSQFVYAVKDTREIKSWILSWGATAEVLDPPELRDEILNEALRMVEMLT